MVKVNDLLLVQLLLFQVLTLGRIQKWSSRNNQDTQADKAVRSPAYPSAFFPGIAESSVFTRTGHRTLPLFCLVWMWYHSSSERRYKISIFVLETINYLFFLKILATQSEVSNKEPSPAIKFTSHKSLSRKTSWTFPDPSENDPSARRYTNHSKQRVKFILFGD